MTADVLDVNKPYSCRKAFNRASRQLLLMNPINDFLNAVMSRADVLVLALWFDWKTCSESLIFSFRSSLFRGVPLLSKSRTSCDAQLCWWKISKHFLRHLSNSLSFYRNFQLYTVNSCLVLHRKENKQKIKDFYILK